MAFEGDGTSSLLRMRLTPVAMRPSSHENDSTDSAEARSSGEQLCKGLADVLSNKIPLTIGFVNCTQRVAVVYLLPCCQGKLGELSEKIVSTLCTSYFVTQ